ncbi:gephyrin-like molybdotransferase receptor GlpR [Streptomyces sp. TLI_146]|uniref:divisome protein SepX/GlpR n=1 Tax=Streptomyces sp. TLI_146 TaxID=1938858 RepID=UPI000C70144E|nr:gephyrin-like molybdotransferase receptor GlpR [Streptomyces sp. TLI_146]
MSSSGLIYAVIVGAWAAYLVPMWLRRQDELNEARPTERFSTAIRLLSGRSAMERRYAKELRQRGSGDPAADADPDAPTESLGDPAKGVDVRDFAVPRQHPTGAGAQRPGGREEPRPQGARPEDPHRDESRPEQSHSEQSRPEPSRSEERRGGERRGDERPGGARQGDGRRRDGRSADAAERARRARRSAVLARRRRTTVILFLAFTLGTVVAAVGGLAFLWAPAVPAVLLSAYIVHLRARERRRFAFVMDRRRAEAAAARLRERQPRRQPAPVAETEDEPEAHPAPEPEPVVSPQEADRRALVEQTDHAEWVDQQRERGPERGDSWEPVPVPLPTYVTAPVAPRATGSIDLGAPDTWSSARSSTADPTAVAPPAPRRRTSQSGRRTPLFDQYADDDRPRAANE